MPRPSSWLFVAAAENVLLSVLGYPMLTGLMDLTFPADFSPGMRGVLLSQLVLVLIAAAWMAGLSFADRSGVLISAGDVAASYAEDGDEDEAGRAATDSARSAEANGDANGNDQMLSSFAAWASRRMQLCRLFMAAANAYSVLAMGLLLGFIACVVQCSTGWGLREDLEARTSASAGAAVVVVYSSSQRLDWVQAIAGGAVGGWVDKVR